MKNITYIIFASLLLFSCGPKETNDLAGKKKQLTEKKTELKALQGEIDKLREEILELDPPKEKAPVLVTIESVTPKDFVRYTDVQASVMSDNVVFASSEMGGRIVSMTAKEGQYVKRGQLIASVDLQTLKDQKSELETGMSLAKDVYDRQKRLWDQNIGTEIQYLQAKNSYERLQKSLKISADVPESYLGKIKRGDKVKVSFPALGVEETKVVSLVGRSIDPSNRTFKVEINTNNMGGKLKPNLLAEIAFNDFSQKDAVAVDLPLVQEEVSGKKYIYTIGQKDGKQVAQKSYVSIGESSEGKVIITEGLRADDKIILDGARSVSPGAPVKELSK